MEIISLLGIGWLAAALLMLALWCVQRKTKNAGWVDFGWVVGLMILAGVYALATSGPGMRRYIIFAMVVLWGMRLGSLLWKRLTQEKIEDKRYQKIRADWKTNVDLKFFFMFQFQAFLGVVLSAPFLFACLNPQLRLSGWELLGILVWAAGLLGETLADEQLKNFKKEPANKGKVCESGLWYYSRHPNYFFEWVVWVGFFIFALGSPLGWVAIISPALMLYFLLKVTGVPLAEEQSLKSRGDAYRDYQRRTSIFLPLPKRN